MCSFTVSIAKDNLYGNYNGTSQRWNGIIRELLEKEVDAAITDLTIDEKRFQAVDQLNAMETQQ